ncbi:hypothetical protein [Pseudoalteromonas luteoviolacea]|uniref:Dystroglycan-type cadherin-like domain-containing protein n=1 Tax=Pseudoalteromonas luteoviolacea S4054 TaxID=1129367 RepID=A0A0F6A5B8_9GAMM|nr:hypothetical protein [Pseudoalteromonas luteoviolacea]AOT07633.1 hypothetical protein S4054249_07160 [Pseudoalteromonas luteoviolacea]AOT12549.1 hypothetical protein S40542_07160 [Pseudoalteromonas luteoviolacea]AOT17463.1 hypothetical protein S4054_07160 [Pseudoalteromonas luteoviolacea]KKE81375.1 hypothetical protein N479_22845 [Pseudoalteromonas luteoviolacea S4054]KZN70616.1 hypothetical protein N481_20585 [Pseudoalteromonas luteoviolacea S4047-1]
MKKIFLSGLLASMLSGCGGSDSEPTSNTAPTLVGNLEQEVLALESGIFTFTLDDKELDNITVTTSNAPHWIVNTDKENTLTITATPDLLAVGEHTFTVTLSDGKDRADYNLKISVKDNPEKWEEIDIHYDSLVGGWESQDKQAIFAFNSAQQGVSILNNQFTYLAYENEGTDAPGFYKLNCYVEKFECGEGDLGRHAFPFRIIAQSDSKLRVVFEDATEHQQVTTLTKQESPQISKTMQYHVPSNGYINYENLLMGEIDFEGQSAVLSLNINQQYFGGTHQLDQALVRAEIIDNQTVSIHNDDNKVRYNDYFSEPTSKKLTHYIFKHKYNSLKLLYSSDDYAVFDIEISRELSSAEGFSGEISDDVKAQIEATFVSENSISVIASAKKTANMTPEQGKKYVSTFYLDNDIESILSKRSRVSYFTIIDELSSKIELGTLFQNPVEKEAMITVFDAKLAIEYQGINTEVDFVKIANNNDTFLASHAVEGYGETYSRFLSILSEVNDSINKESFINRSFKGDSGSVYEFSETTLKIHKTASTFSEYKVIYQDDGSVIATQCPQELVNNMCPEEEWSTTQYKMVQESLNHVVIHEQLYLGDVNMSNVYKMTKL